MPRAEPIADVHLPKSDGVVELIEGQRHQKLRNAGGQALRRAADASVMHHRLRMRQQPSKGDEVEVTRMRRHSWRQLLGEPRQQHRPNAEARTCVDRGLEKLAAMHVRRAGCERDKRFGRVDESLHFGRRRDDIGLVIQRKAREHRLSRPVGLSRREPVGEGRQHELR